MLTKSAMYTLHLMNDHSEDLPFLSLPEVDGVSNRKEHLQAVLKQGYNDLIAEGLVEDGEPTERFMLYGVYMADYFDALYHIKIDEDYMLALDVDKEKRKAVLIRQVEEGRFDIIRLEKSVALALLIANHPVLQNMDDYEMDYLRQSWETMPFIRLIYLYGNKQSCRIQCQKVGKLVSDWVIIKNDKHLLQYDTRQELIHSVSSEQVKDLFLQELKVVI